MLLLFLPVVIICTEVLIHTMLRHQFDFPTLPYKVGRQEFLLLNPSGLAVKLSEPSLSMKWDIQKTTS